MHSHRVPAAFSSHTCCILIAYLLHYHRASAAFSSRTCCIIITYLLHSHRIPAAFSSHTCCILIAYLLHYHHVSAVFSTRRIACGRISRVASLELAYLMVASIASLRIYAVAFPAIVSLQSHFLQSLIAGLGWL